MGRGNSKDHPRWPEWLQSPSALFESLEPEAVAALCFFSLIPALILIKRLLSSPKTEAQTAHSDEGNASKVHTHASDAPKQRRLAKHCSHLEVYYRRQHKRMRRMSQVLSAANPSQTGPAEGCEEGLASPVSELSYSFDGEETDRLPPLHSRRWLEPLLHPCSAEA